MWRVPPSCLTRGRAQLAEIQVTVPFQFVLFYFYSKFCFFLKEAAIYFVWKWKAWALLSHYLNVFVVMLQSEEILKDALKPLCFVSAAFSPVEKKENAYASGTSPQKRHFLRHLMKYEYFSQLLRKCLKTDVRCRTAAAERLQRYIPTRSVPAGVSFAEIWQKRVTRERDEEVVHQDGSPSAGLLHAGGFLKQRLSWRACPESCRYWNIHVDQKWLNTLPCFFPVIDFICIFC